MFLIRTFLTQVQRPWEVLAWACHRPSWAGVSTAMNNDPECSWGHRARYIGVGTPEGSEHSFVRYWKQRQFLREEPKMSAGLRLSYGQNVSSLCVPHGSLVSTVLWVIHGRGLLLKECGGSMCGEREEVLPRVMASSDSERWRCGRTKDSFKSTCQAAPGISLSWSEYSAWIRGGSSHCWVIKKT